MHSLGYLEHLSYFGVFLAMATTGYLMPVPEEIILLVGGYLIASHVSNPWIMLFVSFFGVLVGDSIIYYIAHHGGRLAEKWKARIEKSRFKGSIAWFRRHSHSAIFLIRFIPGMRFASPVLSGFLSIPWGLFITYDALAAVIFVPLITAIGYAAHRNINAALHYATIARHVVIESILVILIVLPVLFFIRALAKRQF